MDIYGRFFSENSHLGSQRENILSAVDAITDTYRQGGKVLICGNGGSAADSEHIVGELMKGFMSRRPLDEETKRRLREKVGGEEAEFLISNLQRALPAISLVSHSALISAFSNDVSSRTVYAQQVLGYGKPGDVLIGISTSGNSQNVVDAVQVARALGLKTISLTGCRDSRLSALSDVTIRSIESETYKVQEDHLRIYHLICMKVEENIFG